MKRLATSLTVVVTLVVTLVMLAGCSTNNGNGSSGKAGGTRNRISLSSDMLTGAAYDVRPESIRKAEGTTHHLMVDTFLSVRQGNQGAVWECENQDFAVAPGYPGGPPPTTGPFFIYYYKQDGRFFTYGWEASPEHWSLENGQLVRHQF